MKRLFFLAALLLAPFTSLAQTYNQAFTPDISQKLPVFAIACQDSQGRSLPPGSPTCVNAAQTVSGTVTSNQGAPNSGGTQAWPVQWSGQTVGVTSLPPVVQGAGGSSPWAVSWTGQTVGVTSLPSLPAGTNTIGAVSQAGAPWSISGTVTANLGTLNGAATAAAQTAVQSAPGTSATTAQGVQGVTGGVPIAATLTNPAPSTVTANQGTPGASPWPAIVAQYNATLPTLASGTTAPLAIDSSGRLIQAPGASVIVTSLPSIPAGSNAIGSVSVSNFPATQPVSAASLPLPAGAATAAGQTAQQGPVAPGAASSNSVLAGVVYNSTAPAPTNGQQLALQSDAAGNLKINNATLSPGAATAANQANTAPGTSATTAQGVQGVTGGVPVPTSTASGQNATEGSTTDTPYTGAASATAASINATLKSMYNLLQGGSARLGVAISALGSIPSGLAANATSTGGMDSGVANGNLQYWKSFNVGFLPNQSGTLALQVSNDNTNWIPDSATINVTAGTWASLSAPIVARYTRFLFTNGSTATTASAVVNYQLTAN